MLKRKPIDMYIRRATAGLPRLERVDTAAEIRVHLLQKTRELMAQGFPREEAEHLAVQEMGPVAATNRAFLGHIFTSSLGWVVVGLTVIASGIWISQRQPANSTLTLEKITEQWRSDSGPNYNGVVQDYRLVLPPGTTRILGGVCGVNGCSYGARMLELDPKKTVSTEIKLRVGVYAGPIANCPSGFFSNIKILDPTPEQSMIGMTPNISTCIKTKKPLPSWSDNAVILYPTTPEIADTQLNFNHWIPLMNFQNPEPKARNIIGVSETLANTPANWMSIAISNSNNSTVLDQPLFVTTTQKLGIKKLEAVQTQFTSDWARGRDSNIETSSIRPDRVLLDEYGIIEGETAVFNIQTTPNIKRLEVVGRFGKQVVLQQSIKLGHPKSRLLIGGRTSNKECSSQKAFTVATLNGNQPIEVRDYCLHVGNQNVGTGYFSNMMLDLPKDATPDQWIPIWAKVPHGTSGLINQNPAKWMLLEVKFSTSEAASSIPKTEYQNIPPFGYDNQSRKDFKDWNGRLILNP
jgi:hypothetical protein